MYEVDASQPYALTAQESLEMIIENSELYSLYLKTPVEKAVVIDKLISETAKYESLYGTGLLFDGESVSIHLRNLASRYDFYTEEECKEILYDYILVNAYERDEASIVDVIVSEDRASNKSLDIFKIGEDYISDLFDDFSHNNRKLSEKEIKEKFYEEVLEVDGKQLVKVVSWYDNEMSYTSQMIKTMKVLLNK